MKTNHKKHLNYWYYITDKIYCQINPCSNLIYNLTYGLDTVTNIDFIIFIVQQVGMFSIVKVKNQICANQFTDYKIKTTKAKKELLQMEQALK